MRSKLKIVIPAAIAALSVAAVAPSYAQNPEVQTSVKVNATVTPNKAGTKKHPQTVALRVRAELNTVGPDGLNKPVLQKMEVLFPKGSLYRGNKAPKCTEAQLARNVPKAVCPKAIMGTGVGHGWADTEKVKADFTVVNGGNSRAFIYTEMTNPALVQKAVVGKISKQKGKWAYKLTADVPQELQVVAGIPISIIDIDIKTNKAAKKYGWLATTSCPKNKKWPYQGTGWFDNGNKITYNSFVRCK